MINYYHCQWSLPRATQIRVLQIVVSSRAIFGTHASTALALALLRTISLAPFATFNITFEMIFNRKSHAFVVYLEVIYSAITKLL